MSLVRRLVATLRARPLLADVAFALGYAAWSVGVVAFVYASPETAPEGVPIWIPAVAATLAALPLAVRRVLPEVALVACGAAYVVVVLAMLPAGTGPANAVFIAIYSAGAHLPARRAALVRGAVITALFAVFITHLAVRTPGMAPSGFAALVAGMLLVNGFLFGVVWVIGDAMRQKREFERALVARTAELERERDARAAQAVLEERVRIARELHDVVAHHVSLAGVQAGAARRIVGRDPAQAGELMASIEATSRDAVNDLQRVLGMLRDADTEMSREPQPSLASLGSLVAREREAGLHVMLDVTGAPQRPLPPGVDLSAYRIVQEALTNVRKHAGATASATVRVAYGAEVVRLEIANPVERGKVGDHRGHGLIGMRERAALYGGSFSAGQSGGQFTVQVTLPVGERLPALPDPAHAT